MSLYRKKTFLLNWSLIFDLKYINGPLSGIYLKTPPNLIENFEFENEIFMLGNAILVN